MLVVNGSGHRVDKMIILEQFEIEICHFACLFAPSIVVSSQDKFQLTVNTELFGFFIV